MSKSVAVLGSDQVPLAYTVPVPGTLTTLAASAVFDGSAAGTFQPALSFYDSDGNLISRAVGGTVAAGGSAEVSWFPRVGGGGSSGTASLPACFVDGPDVTLSTLVGGAYTAVTWNLFDTNDTSTFSFPGGGGNTTVSHLTKGLYRAVFIPKFSGFTFPAAPGVFLYTIAASSLSTARDPTQFSINAPSASWAVGDTNASGRDAPHVDELYNFSGSGDFTVNTGWTGAGTITFSPRMYVYRIGNQLV